MVDAGGVHFNSGVQSHWFYVLANGAANTNDNGDYFNVTGIGMDDAARIAYLTMTTLMSTSQYTDSRMASIQASINLFGECSQQHRSTVDAWYAVGIGGVNTCHPLSNTDISKSIMIYPNPANTVFSISTEGLELVKDVKIYSINGTLVKSINQGNLLNIDVSDLSTGTYIVRVNIDGKFLSKKLIIKSND